MNKTIHYQLSQYEKYIIDNMRKDGVMSIWTFDDFENCIATMENPAKYDINKIPYALKMLRKRWESKYSITESTIEEYLDIYCLKEKQ